MRLPSRRASIRSSLRHTHPVRALAPALAALLIAGTAGAALPAHAAHPRPPASAHLTGAVASGTHSAVLPRSFGSMALSFEPNRGQAAAGTRFLARGRGYSVALTASGATLTLPATHATGTTLAPARPAVVHMSLLGGNTAAPVQGQQQLPGTVSYLSGRDRKKWLTTIPTYGAVRYSAVYRGVDLLYYGSQQRLEYDFQVAPGADPRQIRMAFGGVEKLTLAANGDLLLRTAGGVLRERRPLLYQLIHGARRQVGGGYRLAGRQVGFRVGTYNRHLPLVIDPVLVYSTYYGGAGADQASGVAVDGQGNVYVVGTTTSGHAAKTAFVSKFDPTGTQVLWTQYLGNAVVNNNVAVACDSTGSAIALDGQGNVYVTGLYGDVGADSWDNNLCVTKVVLWLKIDPSGNAAFTTFGKYDTSQGNAIAVDGQGNTYVTGSTEQTEANFPVTNGAFQTTPGIDKTPSGGVAGDAFVLKVDSSGNVVYGTFLGGSGLDDGLGIAVDGHGDAVVAGSTSGTVNGLSDFPVTANALQTQPGNLWAPAFVGELNPNGSALLYSTFLSGNNGESANGVAVDGLGHIYVVGQTNSDNFPATPNAYKPTCGTDGMCNATKTWYCDPSTNTCYWQIQAPEDVFVTELDPSQSGAASLLYSTFLGGMNRDLGTAIALDSHNNVYITGRTASIGDFPTRLPSQPALGGDYDAFAAKLDLTKPGDAGLIYSTYLGGSGYDEGDAIAVDTSGNAYVAGYTASTDFPTQTPAQAANNGGSSDAFLAKLSAQAPLVVSTLTFGSGSVVAGQSASGTITLNAPAPAGGASVTLTSGNAAASVPASVVVPAGATSASFSVSTQAVGAPTSVTLTASYGGVSQTAQLTVNPAPPTATATTPAKPTTPPTQAPPPPTQAPTQPAATPTQPAPVATATATHPAGTTAAPSPTPTSPATSSGSSGSGSHGSSGSGSAGSSGTGAPSQPGRTQGGTAAGAPHSHALSLAVSNQPARIALGSILVVSGRTAPRANVSATLDVTASRVSFTGKGKHRKRVSHTVVLDHVAGQGNADRHGRFTLRLRLVGKPHVPAHARLTIRASAGQGMATRISGLTIVAPVRYVPHRQHHGGARHHR